MQPQRRDAHEQTEQPCENGTEQAAAENDQNELAGGCFGCLEQARALERKRGQRSGVGADAGKTHVAERELAQVAKREIERRAEQDENAHLPDDRHQHAAVSILREHLTEQQHHGKEQHDQAAVDAGTAQFRFLQRIHTFSPTFFPRMPAGLTSSITIRIRNTTALASDELI